MARALSGVAIVFKDKSCIITAYAETPNTDDAKKKV